MTECLAIVILLALGFEGARIVAKEREIVFRLIRLTSYKQQREEGKSNPGLDG
jgi:hypothetical protein